jgi:signal peptidase I
MFTTAYRPVIVRGHSMRPTLHPGQVVLMERRAAGQPRIRVGDVVVFQYKRDTCIKRVYATGGSVVSLARFAGGGTFLLESIGEPGRVNRIFHAHPDLGHVIRMKLPAHTLFVVGDNANVSNDSRDYGPVPESAVLGCVPSLARAPASPTRRPRHEPRAVAGVPLPLRFRA